MPWVPRIRIRICRSCSQHCLATALGRKFERSGGRRESLPLTQPFAVSPHVSAEPGIFARRPEVTDAKDQSRDLSPSRAIRQLPAVMSVVWRCLWSVLKVHFYYTSPLANSSTGVESLFLVSARHYVVV